MKYYCYNRISTVQQHLDRGEKDIRDFCNSRNLPLRKVFSDKQTGRNFDRPRYIVLKEDVLDTGDVLIISEADRLGRSKVETLKELEYFKNNDIRVMILDIPTTLIDLDSLEDSIAKMYLEMINNMLIEIYVTLAQAEVDKKKIQQRKGIEAMKARGEWGKYGRPRVMSYDKFAIEYQRVISGSIKPFQLIRELDLTIPTYYRYRKAYHEKNTYLSSC